MPTATKISQEVKEGVGLAHGMNSPRLLRYPGPGSWMLSRTGGNSKNTPKYQKKS